MKIGPITPYVFRHSLGTHLANKPNANLRSIQNLLGHTTINMTTVYAHATDETVRKTIDEMENTLTEI